jgi:hypothetical protein
MAQQLVVGAAVASNTTRRTFMSSAISDSSAVIERRLWDLRARLDEEAESGAQPYRQMFDLMSALGRRGDLDHVCAELRRACVENAQDPLTRYLYAASLLLHHKPLLEEAEHEARLALELLKAGVLSPPKLARL